MTPFDVVVNQAKSYYKHAWIQFSSSIITEKLYNFKVWNCSLLPLFIFFIDINTFCFTRLLEGISHETPNAQHYNFAIVSYTFPFFSSICY